MEDNKKQEKQNFLKQILEAGKRIASLTKDPKVNKAIKDRANY
jgi:uncharacterized protein with HEPN domain